MNAKQRKQHMKAMVSVLQASVDELTLDENLRSAMQEVLRLQKENARLEKEIEQLRKAK